MLENFLVVAGSVATLFLLMAVGFFLARRGMLSEGTLSQLAKMILYIVCPCILIDTFQNQPRTGEMLRQFLTAFLALAGTYLLNMGLIQLLFRRAPREERGVLRFTSIYANTGFMGIPLIQSVLGDAGMGTVAMCMLVFTLSVWTHGAYLVGGRGLVSPKKALLNPGVLGFAAAFLLFATGLRLPGPLGTAVGYVGSLNTPLAMIVLGGQTAAVKLGAVFRSGRLYAASAVKLVAVPLVTLLVLLPFRLESTVFMAVVILASCPTAGMCALMCQSLGKDTSLAAQQMALSTVLCLITLPLVATLARMLAG